MAIAARASSSVNRLTVVGAWRRLLIISGFALGGACLACVQIEASVGLRSYDRGPCPSR